MVLDKKKAVKIHLVKWPRKCVSKEKQPDLRNLIFKNHALGLCRFPLEFGLLWSQVVRSKSWLQ